MNMRYLLEILLNPYLICFLLLAISIYFLWKQKNTRLIKLLCVVSLVGLYSISTFLPYLLSNYLENQYPPVLHIDPKIKWVVVLAGGKSDRPGMPANFILTSASMVRLIEGVRLFNLLPNANLVLSGGGVTQTKSEAELLNELTSWFAIPNERIILDTKSLNTANQADALQSIVHQEPFYLVTSASHMPRAMTLCLRAGLHPIAAPTYFTSQYSLGIDDFIPNTYNVAQFSTVFHELLGHLWIRLHQ